MYAFVLLLAAATALSEQEPVDPSSDPQLAGGTAVCRPDVRGAEERMMRAFLAGAYLPTNDRRFRCRIA